MLPSRLVQSPVLPTQTPSALTLIKVLAQIVSYHFISIPGLLGSYVTARAYSGTTPDDEYVRSDRDLSCINALSCSWQNVAGDQLDWLQGEGNVDSNRLQLISGSSVLPDHSFLLLGSTPRPPDHAGLFVSPLIGCQQSSGILSFRYWRR